MHPYLLFYIKRTDSLPQHMLCYAQYQFANNYKSYSYYISESGVAFIDSANYFGMVDFLYGGSQIIISKYNCTSFSEDKFSSPLGSWVSLWNFGTITGSLMTPKWQKLASLAQEICTL